MKEQKPKIGILSLGCPRNLVDSESILGRLNLKGYPLVDIVKADVAIVNTCAFIEDARVESIDAILDLVDLKRRGRLRKIIVYGCLSQRYKHELAKELPEIDAFVGRISLNHDTRSFSITPRHFAYLKICEGCINSCSYCVIPDIKGRFLSLDKESILKKVEDFNQEGVAELNIIGQDITGYGLDLSGRQNLTQLLKDIVKKSARIGWLRLLYLYPSRVSDELIDLISAEPKVCKYIDLPIQHINDRILKLMNRAVTKKDIFKLIGKIRKRIPDVSLRTSIIVGFPSETESEFKELLGFVEDAKFERLGVFIYSREEATMAAGFKQQVPKKIKAERFDAVMSIQQKISRELNQRFLGCKLEVLIDEKERDCYLGRTQSDAPEVDGLVYVNSRVPLRPGDFVKVKINDTLEYDLVGEVV
jgi:ribosomal protein S12 methylthiotransferase